MLNLGVVLKITAQYAGNCSSCGKRFAPGVKLYPALDGHGWRHTNCALAPEVVSFSDAELDYTLGQLHSPLMQAWAQRLMAS